MLSIPDILSLKVSIMKDDVLHYGIALGERYPNKAILILERYYNTVSDLDVELAFNNGLEFIDEIMEDWGEMFEQNKPKE